MKKDIIKLFNLTGVIVDKVDINNEILIYVRSPKVYAKCNNCGTSSKKIHQIKQRKVRHGILNFKKVFLIIKTRRFKCKKCCKPFTEQNIQGVTRQRFTESFKESVLSELPNSDFKSVASRYLISSPTVLSFLKEKKKEITWSEGEIILNIDEHSYSGRDLKITVGDFKNKRLVAILKDDRKQTLIDFLKSIPKPVKQRISEVCIDMKVSYLNAIKQELPDAIIVVDHFHIQKELLRQMEEIRKIIQPLGAVGKKRINRFLLLKNKDKLKDWEKEKLEEVFVEFKRYPTLYYTWWTKEKMREVYQSKDYETAEKRLNNLLKLLSDQEIGKLKEIRGTLERWKPYILNYFHNRTTNAFIEGCHNKIKLIKRTSYGFRNFENYCLKVTLAFLPFVFLPNLAH